MIRLVMARLFIATLLFIYSNLPVQGQATEIKPFAKETVKPFRIVTSGKQITIKSSKNIKSVMVWTSNGNRLSEQREINNTTHTVKITINDKLFFVMIQLEGGRVYTEKVSL